MSFFAALFSASYLPGIFGLKFFTALFAFFCAEFWSNFMRGNTLVSFATLLALSFGCALFGAYDSVGASGEEI